MENQIVLKLIPGDQQATGPASFTVQVENPIDLEIQVGLSAKMLRGDCAFQFVPEKVAVPAHSQAAVVLTVTPNAAVTVRTVHAFTLHAVPDTEGVQGAYCVGQLVQVPGAATAPPLAVAAAAIAATDADVTPEPSPTTEPAPLQAAAAAPIVAASSSDRLLLNLVPATQTASGGAAYRVEVANPFTRPVQVSLTAYDASNRVSVIVNPPTLLLGALGEANAQATVTPLTALQPNETQRTCNFEIHANLSDSAGSEIVRGTLIQMPPPKQAIAWLPIAIAIAAFLGVLLLIAAFLNREDTSTNPVPLPTNVLVTPFQPTILVTPVVVTRVVPVTGVPVTAAPITSAPITAAPPTNAQPVTAVPVTNAPPPTNPGATVPPTFAITGVVAEVEPSTSAVCPQLFRFSGTITASGTGNAVYQWEFSNGVKTNPVTVPLKDSGQAVVQGNVELAQSTEGWGQLQVLSPVPLASNRAALVLTCPAGQPTALPTTAP